MCSEGSKGQYGWADIDRLMETAQLNGIKLLLSVVKAPAWARGSGGDLGVEGPPVNLHDYADFVGAMAARYRGRVQAYEIWNEQNLHYEWGNEPSDANRYVELLKSAYLGEIRAPTLVITGTADQLTPTKYAHFLAQNIPGAQLVLVENAGHMVMLERPREVGEAVARFVASL
jgi:pimeloyl-ACP methyl ester carboxylesterase